MNPTDRNLLEKLVHAAAGLVYEQDKYLLNLNCDAGSIQDEQKHAAERSVMFRFAYYMQRLIETEAEYEELRSYNVDCEYNRNIYDIKRLPSFPGGVVPDTIIHKRGSNDNNLLVIEIKPWWNKERDKDCKKLKEFTSPDGTYRYLFGLWLLFDKEKHKLTWFENGEKLPTAQQKR